MLAQPSLPRWDCLSDAVPQGLPFDHRHLQVQCMNTPAPHWVFRSDNTETGPKDARRVECEWEPDNTPRNQWIPCFNTNLTLFEERVVDSGSRSRRILRSHELDFFQCRGPAWLQGPGIRNHRLKWVCTDCAKRDFFTFEFTTKDHNRILPLCRDCSVHQTNKGPIEGEDF